MGSGTEKLGHREEVEYPAQVMREFDFKRAREGTVSASENREKRREKKKKKKHCWGERELNARLFYLSPSKNERGVAPGSGRLPPIRTSKEENWSDVRIQHLLRRALKNKDEGRIAYNGE